MHMISSDNQSSTALVCLCLKELSLFQVTFVCSNHMSECGHITLDSCLRRLSIPGHQTHGMHSTSNIYINDLE